MSASEFKRASDFPFVIEGQEAEPLECVHFKQNLKITVGATSRQQAWDVATSVSDALELGLPAAQAVIVEHINSANDNETPLVCTLTCQL